MGCVKSPVLVAYPGPMRTQMAWDCAPDNNEERVAGRLPPANAASKIVQSALKGNDAEVVVATPTVEAMVARARRDPRWGAGMMNVWQLGPTIAKATAEGRDPGL